MIELGEDALDRPAGYGLNDREIQEHDREQRRHDQKQAPDDVGGHANARRRSRAEAERSTTASAGGVQPGGLRLVVPPGVDREALGGHDFGSAEAIPVEQPVGEQCRSGESW